MARKPKEDPTAKIVYDTATEFAVPGGLGYWHPNMVGYNDYARPIFNLLKNI